MSATDRTTSVRTDRTAVQKAALTVGTVFLAVGVLGFIPGVTTNYSSMSLWSHHSDAMLLGIFQVSILHNIVHLLFGVAGLALARTVSGASNYPLWGGVIYLVLFVYGLIVDQRSAANFVPVNPADDVLHLVLGVGVIALGVALTRRSRVVNGQPFSSTMSMEPTVEPVRIQRVFVTKDGTLLGWVTIPT